MRKSRRTHSNLFILASKTVSETGKQWNNILKLPGHNRMVQSEMILPWRPLTYGKPDHLTIDPP